MGWLLFFLTAVYAVESLLTMRASVLGSHIKTSARRSAKLKF